MEEKLTERDISMLEILERLMDYFADRELLVSASSSYSFMTDYKDGYKGVDVTVRKEQIDIDNCTFVEKGKYFDTFTKNGIHFMVTNRDRES